MTTTQYRPAFAGPATLPTLVSALLYFDVSFMAWVILGPLAPFLRQQFGLSATEQGLLVAIPLLGGSLFRPVLGVLADRIGGRRAGLVGLGLTIAALAIGWTLVTRDVAVCSCSGSSSGIAGASFAVALPLASRWYPAEYQGLAMGIVGAGNSGSLMATLFAPRLAERIGWANTFGLAMLPVVGVAILFALLAKDSPAKAAKAGWRDYTEVLREPDTLWFSFLVQPHVRRLRRLHELSDDVLPRAVSRCRASAPATSRRSSWYREACCGRVGGWLSDRVGGYRLLLSLLGVVAACLGVVAVLPPLAVVVPMLFVTVGCLGMGNGAVFQLVPQRFASRMGIITGVVGAAGGLGGFFLPSILGAAKDATGTLRNGADAVRRRVRRRERSCCSNSDRAGRRPGRRRGEAVGDFL